MSPFNSYTYKLNFTSNGSGATRPVSERIFMVVSHYDAADEAPHFAVGRRIGGINDGELIRVRLTTVKERIADIPALSEEKVRDTYVSGKLKRPSLESKAKQNAQLLAFDDCRSLGKNAEGIAEYRAHWPRTMTAKPEAEVLKGIAHVRLEDANPEKGLKAKAFVEFLHESAMVDATNIDSALLNALRTKDDQDRTRNPLALIRVFHEGEQVAGSWIYPDMEPAQVFDQKAQENRDILRNVSGAETFDRLVSGKPTGNDTSDYFRDIARSLLAGLRQEDEPALVSTDASKHEGIRHLYYGAKEGGLEVEIIAAERIDFCPDTAKFLLKEKDNAYAPVSAYIIKPKPESEDEADKKVVGRPGYTETVIAFLRHPDGAPYAVFASPTAAWPKRAMQQLKDIKPGVLPRLALKACQDGG